MILIMVMMMMMMMVMQVADEPELPIQPRIASKQDHPQRGELDNNMRNENTQGDKIV